MNSVRPEHRLLALALPVGGEETAREIRGLCAGPMDWDYLLDAGYRLGARAQLGDAIRGAGADAPERVRAACQEALTRGVMRFIVATRVMGELRRALHGAGIRFLVLKGLPLASEIYRQPGLRPIGDLDILVTPGDLDTALGVFRGLGYEMPAGSLPLDFYRRHHFHLTLLKDGWYGMPVELHWDTQPYFSLSRIPPAEFWASARPLRVEGLELMVPGRDEAFLYLAQHLMRHVLSFGPRTRDDPVGALLEPARRGRLAWIADLALLARSRPGLDWDRVGALSGRWGLEPELAGLRGYLARGGLWPAGARDHGGHEPDVERGPGIVARAGEMFPRLTRPITALQMRPILALRLLHFACPGGRWIRWRYGLGESSGAVRASWYALVHALGTMGRAARMAAAIAGFRLSAAGRRAGEARVQDARRGPANVPDGRIGARG
jgi:hypothetical protein